MSTPKSGMRRNLTAYGDEEFSLFLRRAFIKAMGYTDDALERPIIGITNTYSGFNACHRTVPELIEAVKRGVMLAGGLPVEFPTITLHESFAHPTSMSLTRQHPRDQRDGHYETHRTGSHGFAYEALAQLAARDELAVAPGEG